jgi:hypothetical protein
VISERQRTKRRGTEIWKTHSSLPLLLLLLLLVLVVVLVVLVVLVVFVVLIVLAVLINLVVLVVLVVLVLVLVLLLLLFSYFSFPFFFLSPFFLLRLDVSYLRVHTLLLLLFCIACSMANPSSVVS